MGVAPAAPLPAKMPEPPDVFPYPPVDLIETDGEPLESDWHRLAMNLLIESVYSAMGERNDYYCSGNMFIYFSEEQVRNKDFRGPDFFFVKNVQREPIRPYWAIWKEKGRYPDVIVELMSATTRHEDLSTKKAIYEKTFHTHEYYCYDPDTKELFGWRLKNGVYQPMVANDKDWLWCEELSLWLGKWVGVHMTRDMTWLRFFDAQGNVVPTYTQAAEKQTEAERQRADAEKQRADAEKQRADAEKQRAEAAEAENARLKAQLQQKQ
ncbi:MAG: Uma2 family endonuclease [Planctomycetes bacterium]|nr:Uma2 family endonuclease [Planctomycetota bacterium]